MCDLFRHSSEIVQNHSEMHLETDWMTAAASGQRERVVQQMPTALPRLARVSPHLQNDWMTAAAVSLSRFRRPAPPNRRDNVACLKMVDIGKLLVSDVTWRLWRAGQESISGSKFTFTVKVGNLSKKVSVDCRLHLRHIHQSCGDLREPAAQLWSYTHKVSSLVRF